jgi:Outer membrane protein beta-barrel domain
MKNLMKSVLVICMLFTVANIEAQVKLGPTAGLNLSTMTLKSMGLSLDPKTVVGFNVGVISEFKLSGNLYLQPALLFTTKGSKFSVLDQEMTITPGFIEIPVNAVYKFGTGSTKFFLDAGPYFGFGISGKTDASGEKTDIKYGSGESDDLKGFDFGLNIGAGVEINRFLVSVHYELGLANLSPVTTDNTESKTRVIGISLAYLMGGK